MNAQPRTTLILVFLISVFAWAGLSYPGYFELHHGFRPIFNLADLARSLPAIGWAPVVGQPFDLWRGEGSLPYWLALLPRGLGATPTTSIKLGFAAGLIGAMLGMYVWARRTLDGWSALTAAAIYGLWPIGLATIYVRGAPAEAVFLAIMPWLLWTVTGHKRHHAVLLALGVAAAVWTQAGLALWFTALLLGYAVSAAGRQPSGTGSAERHRKPTRSMRLRSQAWPIVAGLMLGVAGLAPIAARHGLGGQTYVNFAEHFVYPHQLLWPGWGIEPGMAGPDDTFAFQLGLIACGLAVLGLILSDRNPTTPPPAMLAMPGASRFSLIAALIPVLLATTVAAPFWRLLPFLQNTLTYPWQLLLLAGPWLAWLAGLGSRALLARLPSSRHETATPLVAACLLALIVLGAYGYVRPTRTDTPAPDMPLAIFGADEIALLDARPTIMQPAGADAALLQAGTTISVTVQWQALRPLTRDYTVFLHLTDPNGRLQGQQDTMPLDNQLPTSRWRPGQIVADQYHATLKPGAPASADYRAYLGLYLWQTGERLRTATDDKVAVLP